MTDPPFNPFSLLIPPDQPLPTELYASLYDRLSTRWNRAADNLAASEEFRNIVKRKQSQDNFADGPADQVVFAPHPKRIRRAVTDWEEVVGRRPSSTVIEPFPSRKTSKPVKDETRPISPHERSASSHALRRSISAPASPSPRASAGSYAQERRPSVRAEGLLRVVKSFEQVLNVRADIWRGLGKLEEGYLQHDHARRASLTSMAPQPPAQGATVANRAQPSLDSHHS